MEPKKLVNTRRGPERDIQEGLVKLLLSRRWVVKETHGNIYQSGLPDIYAAHSSYGQRWIECKVKDRYSFTKAQREFFPQLDSVGVGVWILTDYTEEEYMKLFKPANWYTFLEVFK